MGWSRINVKPRAGGQGRNESPCVGPGCRTVACLAAPRLNPGPRAGPALLGTTETATTANQLHQYICGQVRTMHHFSIQKRTNCTPRTCPWPTIAAQVGTPVPTSTPRPPWSGISMPLTRPSTGLDHLVCYAVKANSNRAVIAVHGPPGGRGRHRQRRGADPLPGRRACHPGRIVYSGRGQVRGRDGGRPWKTGILMFNLESVQELARCSTRWPAAWGKKAPVSLRVNPDVDAQTHPKITTGSGQEQVRPGHGAGLYPVPGGGPAAQRGA